MHAHLEQFATGHKAHAVRPGTIGERIIEIIQSDLRLAQELQGLASGPEKHELGAKALVGHLVVDQ